MFGRPGSEVFVPDGTPAEAALARTTHLGIGAHADDLEVMAIHGVLACHASDDQWFTGAVLTDGVGSVQDPARSLDADALRSVRRDEQRAAATLGRYGAQVFFDYSSGSVRDAKKTAVVGDLVTLLRATKPAVVYTHALTDAHDTHVAVTLRVLEACRALGPDERPPRVLGCEVWRDLDWLAPSDKVALPLDGNEELQAALLGVFRSQIDAGKRYDLAALGRRRANAVFSEQRAADRHPGVVWAMDLGPLVTTGVDAVAFVRLLVRGLEEDAVDRIGRLA